MAMLIRKFFLVSILALSASSLSALATDIISTDFNRADVRVYFNNQVINSQEKESEQLTVRSHADINLTKTEIVDGRNNNRYLQFTDNLNEANEKTRQQRVVKKFESVNAIGETQLSGSVDLRFLNYTDPMIFTLALGTSELTGSEVTAIQFGVQTFQNHVLEVYYITAKDRLVWTGVCLSPEKWYTFKFTADLSRGEKSTWTLTISPANGGSALLERSNLATRSGNSEVSILSLLPGGSVSAVNASPWMDLDNLSLKSTR